MTDATRTSKERFNEHAMRVLECANWMHECGHRTRGQQLEAAAKALTDAARLTPEPLTTIGDLSALIHRLRFQYADNGAGYNTEFTADMHAAADELEEREQSFALRHDADMRAIKRWQEAHPGNDLVWPDHADMCMWLLGEIERLRDALESLLPGLILDLRYADLDDDRDAMQSRIDTVTAALGNGQ